MKTIRNLMFAALAICTLTNAPITRAANSAPVRISFHKTLNFGTGVWEGLVAGDCGNGTVSYFDQGPAFGTKVQHFSGEYTVTTGTCSFTAVVSGILNTQKGLIVLNGAVTKGSYAGSQFHVRAQLILTFDQIGNLVSVSSQGEMTITPGS